MENIVSKGCRCIRGGALLLSFLCCVCAASAPAVPQLPGVGQETGGHSEVTVDANGVKWVCEDGVCRIVEDGAEKSAETAPAAKVPEKPSRMILGSRSVDEFLAFLGAAEEAPAEEEKGGGAFESFTWVTLLLAILGGLALNLTPCVLPMIPVNLIIIGKSPMRGAAYGLGMAVAYGVLGALASVGLLAFGSIQSSPWFNAFVAVVFLALAVSMLGFFSIDLARYRPTANTQGASTASLAVPFLLGSLAAVLAGACVAPVLISVIVLTARLFAEGNRLVLALPFALGLGMALPWPFLGAGMKVLPKPGAWMKTVNRVFGVVLLCFAVWYARLAVVGWTGPRGEGAASAADAPRAEGVSVETTPADFESVLAAALAQGKPVFVDCWATWCKNCTAMEATTLADARVKKALSRFAVVKLDASDVEEFRKLAQFKEVIGLPAYAVFE